MEGDHAVTPGRGQGRHTGPAWFGGFIGTRPHSFTRGPAVSTCEHAVECLWQFGRKAKDICCLVLSGKSAPVGIYLGG